MADIYEIILASPDRMPIPIGDFISKYVYNMRLKSQHRITDLGCCRFINVSKGLEVAQGHSWKVRRIKYYLGIASLILMQYQRIFRRLILQLP
jgi:Na+-translocating ferredoxin:NAD+ oxidoreductase RnfA subunit